MELSDFTPQKNPREDSPKKPSGEIPKKELGTPTPIPSAQFEGSDLPEPSNLNETLLRSSTLQEYLDAHAHSYPSRGWSDFFRSNLFAALLIFLLSQGIVFGGFLVTYYIRTNALAEWKGSVETTLKRMDDQGTVHSHYEIERLGNKQAEIDVRLKKVEEDTRHIEVIESEHRRLTKDVEEIRNGKK